MSIYFYPRPPRGGRPLRARTGPVSDDFYPRPPRGGRRSAGPLFGRGLPISIHALREEGDIERICVHSSESDFYPRPPRGGRPSASGDIGCRLQISIHALREEGDTAMSIPPYCGPISIHALREEGDDPGYHGPDIFKPFLSTPSARRATSGPTGQTAAAYAISIHALREEGDRAELYPRFARYISIHALREEGDAFGTRVPKPGVISIHALREEGDYQFCIDLRDDGGFLSTPSARRATPPLPPRCRTWKNFYPRPPRGGRQVDRSGRVVTRVFLSTPSARRATFATSVRVFSFSKFLSTPSARRATQ